jgi:hypothetical protein
MALDILRFLVVLVLTVIGIAPAAELPDIHTEAVTRSYQLYEAAGGHPSGLHTLEKTHAALPRGTAKRKRSSAGRTG